MLDYPTSQKDGLIIERLSSPNILELGPWNGGCRVERLISRTASHLLTQLARSWHTTHLGRWRGLAQSPSPTRLKGAQKMGWAYEKSVSPESVPAETPSSSRAARNQRQN